MRRREFIALAGGVAVGWPLDAYAQQPSRTRRIAVLLGGLEQGDVEGQAEVAAFNDGLKQAGWNVGSNLEIDYHWPGAEIDRIRAAAKKIIDSHPDLVLTRTTPATAELVSANLPVIFLIVADPIGSGFIRSFAQPGGDFTGFTNIEQSVAGKWITLLKETVPTITKVALLFNPTSAPFAESYVKPAQEAAQSLNVDAFGIPVTTPEEIETVLSRLADEGGGFACIPDIFLANNRALIIAHAARHHLPAVYASPTFTPQGGLMAYFIDYPDLFRRVANYVDRILKGAKPADLPVQLPTRFALSLNLKTAKALGLSFPQTLLATADEVIE
jgi:putative tryptophan/tyrosine transport system substrate-binding protein